MSLQKIISVAAVASIGAITWQRLSPEQKTSVKNAVKDGRRKLANFIAPREYLGDLTDSVDPKVVQELEELLSVIEQKEAESNPGDEPGEEHLASE
jgi:hypothetical protein